MILDQGVLDLKALDTFGNCQRPVFLLGIPQHMHKIKQSGLIGHRSCKRIMKQKSPLLHKCVRFVMHNEIIGHKRTGW